MTFSIFYVELPPITFPFHNLKIQALPLQLNHQYYSDLFVNDFLGLIPESFLLAAVFLILLYGTILSNKKNGDKFDLLETGESSKQSQNNGLHNQSPSQGLAWHGQSPSQGLAWLRQGLASHEKHFSSFGGILGINTSLLALLSIVFTVALLANNPISNASVLYSCFLLDDFGLFLKTVLIIASGFSIIISLKYLEQEKLNAFEMQVIVLISSVSMFFLISSVDFISIYLAIEFQSLCFYVMAGMKRESEFSTEAGLKYFVLGAFSSGLLLFGLALQYGFTGTTNFSELSKIFLSIQEGWFSGGDTAFISLSEMKESWLISSWPSAALRGSELGMIFILVGFLFKISAVPFHAWAPDVYEGAPTSVTAFFAIVPKISIFAVLFRVCFGASYGFILSWQKILILSSILSMILGSLAALSQNKIKRLLAWSSIGHVGFLLSALCTGTVEGSQALLFYLIIYIIMTIVLFQVVLSPLRREKIIGWSQLENNPNQYESGIAQNKLVDKEKSQSIILQGLYTQSENQQIKYTSDLTFLSQTNPVIAISIMITMFSIAGIPPLAGFFSKAFILFAAMSAKQFSLAIIIITTSLISCFYYIRIVKIMYFEKQLSKWKSASKERTQNSALTFASFSKESCLVLGVMIALITFFCLFPTFFFKCSHLAALCLSYL